ncbi:MAG: sigma-70 family RNA polymerase sigma factor [Planctomycetaceae bacterium]
MGPLIERWQAGHDPDALAALVARISLPLERLVASVLARRGIRDPGARDDAWALVVEHLARLGQDATAANAAGTGFARVGDFDAARTGGAVDDGWAYIRCLARSRARDVARARKRRERRERPLSDDSSSFVRRAGRSADGGHAAGGAADQQPEATEEAAADAERLRHALDALDGRSRKVVELLLEGRTQVVIAHVLGVCEGTVSRIRVKAVARLQAAMAAKKPGGGGG